MRHHITLATVGAGRLQDGDQFRAQPIPSGDAVYMVFSDRVISRTVTTGTTARKLGDAIDEQSLASSRGAHITAMPVADWFHRASTA